MSALARLENHLAGHILCGDAAIESEVVGTTRVPADVRLGIYRDAYVYRIIEALETDFPGLHALAGDDAWLALTRAYIAAYPSTHFSLRMFGRHFAKFLRDAAPWRDHAVLAEMAEFEWAIAHAFDAADSRTIGIDDIGKVPPDAWADMRLHFHDSVTRIDLHWNVPAIWNAVKTGETPPNPVRANSPIAWIVWRKGLNSYFRSLDRRETAALDVARGGRTFAGLCDALAATMAVEETPVHAASLLKRWVEDEIVSALHV